MSPKLSTAEAARAVGICDCQLEAGEATLSNQLLLESIVSFERALKLDNDRLAWEKLHRFRDRERDAIRSGIVRARGLLQERR